MLFELRRFYRLYSRSDAIDSRARYRRVRSRFLKSGSKAMKSSKRSKLSKSSLLSEAVTAVVDKAPTGAAPLAPYACAYVIAWFAFWFCIQPILVAIRRSCSHSGYKQYEEKERARNEMRRTSSAAEATSR